MSIMRISKISQAFYVTPDLERLTEYYQEVLGLSLIEREGGQVYLGSTVDNHSIVLRQGELPSAMGSVFSLVPI